MTDKPAEDAALREVFTAIVAEWMTDKSAQVGSERKLIGNNFDILIERLVERAEADKQAAVTRAMTFTSADEGEQ
jgi:hypothetical protein